MHAISSYKTSKIPSGLSWLPRFLIKTPLQCTFFEKSLQNIWWFAKNSVPLHPQIRNRPLRLAQVGQEEEPREGSVAQLNRASDYGSEGCGFESRRNHKMQKITSRVYSSSLFFVFWWLARGRAWDRQSQFRLARGRAWDRQSQFVCDHDVVHSSIPFLYIC